MTIVFWILGVILLFLVVFIGLTIQTKVENIVLQKEERKEMVLDYTVKVRLLFLGKVPVGQITITKQKLEKLHLEQKIQQMNWKNIEQELPKKEEAKELFEKLKIQLMAFHLRIDLGIEDVSVTSMLTTLLASGLGWILARAIKRYDPEKYAYEIHPIYENRNAINLQLNCIIQVKMVNIIGMIYILLKRKKKEKNIQVTKQKVYDYSYE